MQLVNLTPHPIRVVLESGDVVEIPTSGQVARVSQKYQDADPVYYEGHTLPVATTEYDQVLNLPDPQPNTLYIVSVLVLNAAPHRHDLLAPDTSPAGAVRDSEGNIIGVRRFLRSADST